MRRGKNDSHQYICIGYNQQASPFTFTVASPRTMVTFLHAKFTTTDGRMREDQQYGTFTSRRHMSVRTVARHIARYVWLRYVSVTRATLPLAATSSRTTVMMFTHTIHTRIYRSSHHSTYDKHASLRVTVRDIDICRASPPRHAVQMTVRHDRCRIALRFTDRRL